MKKTLSFILFAFCITAIYAQSPLTFGVKAGVNFSTLSSIEYADYKLGYNLGFTVEYKLQKNFFFHSGLEFTTKGMQYNGIMKYKSSSDTFIYNESGQVYHSGSIVDKYRKADLELNTLYLQIPVLACYKIEIMASTKILLKAGAYFAYGIGGKEKSYTYESDEAGNPIEPSDLYNYNEDFFDKSTRKLDLGISLGTGIEYHRAILNIGYEHGFRTLREHFNFKNRNLYINLGYNF